MASITVFQTESTSSNLVARPNDYFIFKSILTGLDLSLTGMGLLNFVRSSTGCTLDQFEEVYDQIQEAWTK